MRITSVEEYGLRCLIRVAQQEGGTPLSAQAIAELEGISVPYAQKLMRVLSHGKLVESRRGAQGGYVLAKPIEGISLGDAMRVLGGVIAPENVCERHTGEREVCCNHADCSIRPVWAYLSEFIVRTFDAVPLSMLMRGESEVELLLETLIPAPDVFATSSAS